ncbi:UNVERIFIED_CONTAM: hypothetical protein NCL1_18317 [Trichonephila clavipes]
MNFCVLYSILSSNLCVIFSFQTSKKKQVINEREKIVDNSRVTRERVWDKGKIDQDSDDWSPPRFPEHRSRDQRRFSSDRNIPKKEYRRAKSTNLNKDRQTYFQKSRPSGPSYKYQDSSCQGTSGFRSDNISNAPRPRGGGHRPSRGIHKHFQTSKLDESRNKSLSGGASSRSPNFSRHEVASITYEIKAENDCMWLDDGTTEVQNKQNRVEKWVKSINLSITVTKCDKDNNSNKPNESAGDACSNEAHTSTEHTPLRSNERHEDPKCDQGSRGNYRSQASRTLADERVNVGFDNKYERGMGKNFGDKYSLRRESDISDHTSSMKESDYRDYAMDKFNKASDSKSSNRFGNCQDGDGKHRYVPEAKPFQKQLNIRNWGKDKFYKPRGLRSEGASGCQEAVQKSNLDNEYTKNIRQRDPNSYAKDKLKGKNMRKSDYWGYDEQVAGNRPGSRKLDNYSGRTSKSYNWKTESKFVGNSEQFEDNSAADNNTRSNHKVKYCKPSPKRNLSNTVNSIETSSASKNIELYSPDDGLWGDCKNSGMAWNVDVNDSCPIATRIFRRRETYKQNYVPKKPVNKNYIPKKPVEQKFIPRKTVEQKFIPRKTVEQSYVPKQRNCPNDGSWGDCESSGVAWNVDVNNSSPVEPQTFRRRINKQNYIPKKPSEQNYFPKTPGKQNCFPKKPEDPREPNYTPADPYEPNYTPEDPCEPNFFPEEPCSQNCVPQEEPGEPNYVPEKPFEPNYAPEEPCGQNSTPEELYDPEDPCEYIYDVEDPYEQNFVPEEFDEQNYVSEEFDDHIYDTEEKSCEKNYVSQEPVVQNYTSEEEPNEKKFQYEPVEKDYVPLESVVQNYIPGEPDEQNYVPEAKTGKQSNMSEKEIGEQKDESEEKTGHKNVLPIVFSPPRIINWAEESELYFQRLEAEKELELMNSKNVGSEQELYDDYISVIESKEEGVCYESTRLSIILTDNKTNEWDADSDVKPLTSLNACKSEENKAVDTTENKDALLQADTNENKSLLYHENLHIVPKACNLIINLPPAKTDLKNQSCSFKIDSQISCKQKSHVENDTEKHLHEKFTDSSNQNVKNPSVKEYSESAFKSTVITTSDSGSTTSQENGDLNNKAGAISLSEDGGLSCVSEGKNNNRSAKRKNKKRKASSSKK